MSVTCEAGFTGCDHPKAFSWLGHLLPVQDIIKEWREPDSKIYLVTASNGGCFKLVFSETDLNWSILEVSASPNF
jgi:hypothetical protein